MSPARLSLARSLYLELVAMVDVLIGLWCAFRMPREELAGRGRGDRRGQQ
jgi:hypothetical protein